MSKRSLLELLADMSAVVEGNPAKAMRMAAEICISKRVPNTRSGGVHWRNQACADVINTQADELEKSK